MPGGDDDYTKLLLHMDGADASTTFTDASRAAHGNATAGGTAQVDTAQSKFGGASLLCDGNSDYISYDDHADWDFPGDFTIEAFIRFNSVGANCIFCGNDYQEGWQFSWETTGGGRIQLYVANVLRSYGAWAPSTNTWYHVACVRSGATINLYVDGVQKATVNPNYSDAITSSGKLSIGRDDEYVTGWFNGWIDEFRISKGIARWTANFTPPTQAYGGTARPGVHVGSEPAMY